MQSVHGNRPYLMLPIEYLSCSMFLSQSIYQHITSFQGNTLSICIYVKVLLGLGYLIPSMFRDEHGHQDDNSYAIIFIMDILAGAVFLLYLLQLCKTYRQIRAQMVRRKGDYKEHRAKLCSENELGLSAPLIV